MTRTAGQHIDERLTLPPSHPIFRTIPAFGREVQL